MRCPRCRSHVITQYGEHTCIACGWQPNTLTTEQREMLARDHTKRRRRQPSTLGQKL